MPVPPAYVMFLKILRSTIGNSVSSWCTMNVISEVAATPIRMVMLVLSNQPSRLPSSSTYCSDAMPTARSAMPNTSIFCFDGVNPGSSMKRSASTAARIPSGTFTRKHQCQVDQSMR